MRSVVTLALKDLRLLARDWMALFFIVAFPIIMGVFFGLIGASAGSSSGGGGLTIAICDNDDSEMSRAFIESLGQSRGVRLERHSRVESIDLVRRGRLAGFVAIPPGFGETAGILWLEGPAIELGVDPSRQAEAGMLQGFIMQAMGGLIQQRFMNLGALREQLKKALATGRSQQDIPPALRIPLGAVMGSIDEFLGKLDAQQDDLRAAGGENGPKMELARITLVDVAPPPSAQRELLKKLRSPWDISFPSAMMWGLMGCVAGFASSIVRERTEGTMLRLSVAPLSKTHVLLGKGLGCFLACIGVVAVMMVLGKCLGIQLVRPDLLVLAVFCVALCFVGLMMLMSVLGKTEQAVSGSGWAIITLLCMFGGGMIPLAFMPSFMQKLSHISPVKWGILAIEGAVWRGFTLNEMLMPCGVLLGIGVASFAIGASVLSRDNA